MSRHQLKKGFEAAAWLRQRFCIGRSPYTSVRTEEIVAQSKLGTIKNRFCAPNTSTQPTKHLHIPSNLHAVKTVLCRITAQRNFSSLSSALLVAQRTSSSTLLLTNRSSSKLCVGLRPFAKPFRGFQSFYTGSNHEVQRFQRATFRGSPQRIRQYIFLGIGATGLCIAVYYSHIEVVPYTYRKHFVLVPPDLEAELVEKQFQALKEEWKPYILSPYHPETIRVRKIARDIIRAVLEGLQEDSEAVHVEHEGKVGVPRPDDIEVLVQRGNINFPVASQWRSEEVLDDKWIDKSRKKGVRKGVKPFVEHLKKTKWEVLVVNKDIVNAFCLPSGKIVVFTGLLKRFPMEEEIATVLGHEVAHVVARHSAERMTRYLYLTILQLILLAFFYAPDLVQSFTILFLELPFSRKQELEADHIGLLLMAAAGYDPRVAPHVYEKLGELGGKSVELLQYVTTHPSGKKRGQRLRSTGTMEDALRIYAQRVEGRVTEGFLRAM